MENGLKSKLASGSAAFGTLISMPSPHMARAALSAGLDWLLFDCEHSPIDPGDLHDLIAVTKGYACDALVRVPLDRKGIVRQALDAGASGIVFPMINSAKDAKDAVDLMHYPPEGSRGVGPIYAALHHGVSVPEYLAAANRFVATLILIEDIAAINNLPEILAVPGIDCAIIAPFDLSASLGRPGDVAHADVQDAIAHAEGLIKASPVALGGLASDAAGVRDKLERGYTFVTLGYDTQLIQAALLGMMTGAEKAER